MTAPLTAAVKVGALAAVALASSLALVYSSHLCREFYAELQAQEGIRWALQEDYSRLMLEESTLASPHRVATIAVESLAMAAPSLDPERVVAGGGVRGGAQ